jgi:hypothetical protein
MKTGYLVGSSVLQLVLLMHAEAVPGFRMIPVYQERIIAPQEVAEDTVGKTVQDAGRSGLWYICLSQC